MAKGKNRRWIITLLILGIIAYVLFSGSIELPGSTPKNKIQCAVSIYNPLIPFTPLEFSGTPVCTNIGKCGIFAVQTNALIGTTRLRIEGAVVNSVKVNVGYGDTLAVQLNACVPETLNSGTIELLNEDNQIIDSRVVNF